MNILLIDTSSGNIEFGFSRDSELIINLRLPDGENADTLIYHVKKEFEKRKLQSKDIGAVSISNGPGSFTGLRIGSAIAKGICFATGCKLLEINTLDIIANKYKIASDITETENDFLSAVYSNMRTKEFYIGTYRINKGKIKRISDYSIRKLEDIEKKSKKIIINDIYEENNGDFISLTEQTNINSQLELTLDMVKNDIFSDPNTSEPFYMKEFIPLVKK